jgi:hypothetical protein
MVDGRSSLTFLPGAPSQRLPQLACRLGGSGWAQSRVCHHPYRVTTTTPQSYSSNLCVTRSLRASWGRRGSAEHKKLHGSRMSRRMFGIMSLPYVHTILQFTAVCSSSIFFKVDVVKRWLKAISLSAKPEFYNFLPPLTDEAFELFVQFFWNIKTGNPQKANQLLRSARRHQWGLEPGFSDLTFNKFLESGDDPALSAAAESSWARYTTGQAVQLTGKSRKTLNAVGRKRNSRPFSSANTKRRVTAQSRFQKHSMIARAQPAPEATNSATSQDEIMVVDKGKWRYWYT